MMRYSFLFLFFLCSNFIIFGQEIQIAPNGDQIIVFPDGSWKMYDKNNPKDVALKKKIDEQRRKTEADQLDDIALRNASIEVRDDEQKKATQAAERAIAAEKQALRTYTATTDNRKLMENALNDAKNNKNNYSEKEIARLESLFQDARSRETEAKNAYKIAQKKAELAQKDLKKATQKEKKSLEKNTNETDVPPKETTVIIAEKTNNIVVEPTELPAPRREKIADTTPKSLPILTDSASPKEKKRDKEKSKKEKKEPQPTEITKIILKTLRPEDDVMQNPPKPRCPTVREMRDEFTGKQRKETEKQLFFAHTDEAMRQYMREKPYILCEAQLSSQTGSGVYYLTLYFTIASTNAQNAFGVLEKNSTISFKLLNGESVILLNNRNDKGVVDAFKGSTTYIGQCQLGSEDFAKFSKSEVDKVRVVWSTGYEDYDIYNVDFISNQLQCLNQ